MLDFRKVLLALSVAGLGLVGTASAQVPTFNGNLTVAPFEGYVAQEGTTELLPQLTWTIANGSSLTGSVIFTLTSNVPFNNQALAGSLVPGAVDATVTDTNTGSSGDTFLVTQPGPTTTQIKITFGTGGAGLSQVKVSGLRVNASSLPSGSQVTMTLSSSSLATGGGVILTANAAFVSPSISSVKVVGAANVAVCTPLHATNSAVATVTITNNFLDSFKSAAEIGTGPTGAGYGVTIPPGTAAALGTTLAVTFNNLNAGINYYVPATLTDVTTPSTLTATAYTSIAAPATPATAVTINTLANQVLVPASGTIYYVITAPAAGSGALTIPLIESTNVPTGAPNTAAPSVSVTLAGSATSANPATTYPEYSASQTPYTGTQTPPAAGLLTPCNTTLLFPYLAHDTTYDTGIAIANTGLGAASIIGNTFTPTTTGSCTLTLWGENSFTAPITALPAIALPAVTVTAGTVNAFTLGSMLSALSTPVPVFYGYGIASCAFVGAHAFAQISDYTGTTSAISEGYLAPVLSDITNGAYAANSNPF